ncbi:MAG: putative hydrolase [Gammaproteobacteria bacterium]|jgi:proline iminopeptidase|nr:putative hydrolase [Gammaproteobacteria bacterium]
MRIKINGCKLFFDVYGSKLKVLADRVIEKPTLIVLHGAHGAVDHTLYVEFWSKFSDIAQVIFLDQRGCGRSGGKNKEEWSLQYWAEDLYQFCETLEIEKPIIAGVSMGGHVMCEYIAHHADQPGGLIFCHTEARMVLDDLCAKFESLAGREIAEVARNYFTHPTAESSKEYLEKCVRYYAKNAYTPVEMRRCVSHPEVFLHYCQQQMLKFNYLGDLHKIRCPTLLMVSTETPLHLVKRAEEMFERIKQPLAEMAIFENIGAPAYKDAPEKAYSVVEHFLQQF